MDDLPDLDDHLLEYIEEYDEIARNRSNGFGMEPLLSTLDIYDRKMGIERDPFVVEILITLDAIDRSENAKKKPPDSTKNKKRK